MSEVFKRVFEQEKESKEFGFYWEGIDQIIEQIKSECDEVKEAWLKGDRAHLEEEMGDLLNAAVCLSIFCRLEAEEALLKNTDKYEGRFRRLVKLVKQDGLENLKGKSIDVLLGYWRRAKLVGGEPREIA